MILKSFDESGFAKIKINEEEICILNNALCEYCKTNPEDKRIYGIRRDLFTIYEVVHHGSYFDNLTLKLIKKMRDLEDGNLQCDEQLYED